MNTPQHLTSRVGEYHFSGGDYAALWTSGDARTGEWVYVWLTCEREATAAAVRIDAGEWEAMTTPAQTFVKTGFIEEDDDDAGGPQWGYATKLDAGRYDLAARLTFDEGETLLLDGPAFEVAPKGAKVGGFQIKPPAVRTLRDLLQNCRDVVQAMDKSNAEQFRGGTGRFRVTRPIENILFDRYSATDDLQEFAGGDVLLERLNAFALHAETFLKSRETMTERQWDDLRNETAELQAHADRLHREADGQMQPRATDDS